MLGGIGEKLYNLKESFQYCPIDGADSHSI